MKGLGFYIWRLSSMPPVELLTAVLRGVGAKWVAIKVQDGLSKTNVKGGNDKPLLEVINGLRASGIEVWGWGFVYPLPIVSPGGQAGVASERIQKLDLAGYLIDAEHIVTDLVDCPWMNSPDRIKSANTFMNQLDVNAKYPVMLSSYRFPSQQGPFPFKQFINHEMSKGIAPQMYWLGSHNPRAQLERSINEYQQICNRQIGPEFPYIPFGSTWGQELKSNGKLVYWEPTTADIKEFIQAAKDFKCPAWGFWSLDWVLENNRRDWLEAIAGQEISDPGSGDQQPGDSQGLKFRVLSRVLNIRSGPGVGYPDIGDLHRDEIVEPINVGGVESWIEIEPGKWCCAQQGKYRFLERVE